MALNSLFTLRQGSGRNDWEREAAPSTCGAVV